MTVSKVEDLDVLAPESVADPYPFFERMRRDHPVHWSARYRAWFLYRYEDVLGALRDPAYSSDRVMPVYREHMSEEQQSARKPTFDILRHWMVFVDPPDHARLRKAVVPAFSPKMITALSPRVDAVIEEMLNELRGRGEFDLVGDLAYPVPAVVIAEMMGVPRADRDKFKAWSDQILVLLFGSKSTRDRAVQAQEGLLELTDYLRTHIDRRRADPQDDLISALVHSPRVDPPLTDDELASNCALLIFGGHETTTNLIANGTRALLQHPHWWHRLRSDQELLGPAVEELLRYDGPSKMIMRRLVEDVRLDGHTLTAGQTVYLVQGSANRDEAVFENPAELDLRRTPNRHISFGFGLHHCLGNFLARLEGTAVLGALSRTMPDLRAVPDSEDWSPTLINRGMHHFRVTRSAD